MMRIIWHRNTVLSHKCHIELIIDMILSDQETEMQCQYIFVDSGLTFNTPYTRQDCLNSSYFIYIYEKTSMTMM